MSQIINEALSLIQDRIPKLTQIKTTKVCIGLGYTGVQLSTGKTGICHTLLEKGQNLECCQIIKNAGSLANSNATDLLEYTQSQNIRRRVIGIATLNALSQSTLNSNDYLISDQNFIEYISKQIRKNDTVAMVGYIKPFIQILQRKAKKLYVFERNCEENTEQVLPESDIQELIPQADVAIITGSSIANGTIDNVLNLCRGAREIGIVGPSAGIIPDPLFKRGVTIIGTIKTIDSERLFSIIMEGGGTPQIKSAVKFINIRSKAQPCVHNET